MLKLNYFLADIFILSAEKQPIKLSWRKIEWLLIDSDFSTLFNNITVRHLKLSPNVIYYLIDENRIVIAAMLHSKQSPETVRKTISEFLKQYK